MSVSIKVDLSEVKEYVAELEEKFDSLGDVLEQFLDTNTVPELEAESGSQRTVRTGTYSGTWEASQVDSKSAHVTTEAYYWVYLEYGTSKIAPKPVVTEIAQEMQEPLTEYIITSLGLD